LTSEREPQPESVFGPHNEPYLGLEAVLRFDQVIVLTMDLQHAVGPWTRRHSSELSALQIAATQLVPGSVSIALSIRELIRQAYLFGAAILLRPLVERVATISYLIDDPNGLALWHQGWPHGSRPSFSRLLGYLRSTQEGGADLREERLLAVRYHSLVHGDPRAANEGAILLPDGSAGFTVSKDTDSPVRAAAVASEASAFLAILLARTAEVFPEATPRATLLKAREIVASAREVTAGGRS